MFQLPILMKHEHGLCQNTFKTLKYNMVIQGNHIKIEVMTSHEYEKNSPSPIEAFGDDEL